MYLEEASLLSDLILLAKNGLNALTDGSDRKSGNSYSYSSSAAAAAKLIAIFPILCSSNVSTNTASLMVKQAERKGCLTLQLALTAANGSIDAQSGIDYLNNFHQNLGSGGATVRDYEIMMSRYLNDMMDESADGHQEFNLSTQDTRWFVECLKEMYTDVYNEDASYNPLSLNDFVVTESGDGYKVTIDKYKTFLTEADNDKSIKRDFPEMKDSDVKKMNEAVPSIMIVRFYNKESSIHSQFIIGVKSRLIVADYAEILNKIVSNNRDGHGLTTLIKVLSGETKFARDFLFAIDQAKDDITNAKKKGSNEKIWKELEDRARNAKWMLSQNKTNYAAAITTVVITSEDADLLWKQYNVDIKDKKNARRFMQSYNLFGMVIVNDAEEVAWFMYDDNADSFEKVSYTMLERESSDGVYKKIVNMVSKM